METIREDFLQTICEEQPYKLVISNPATKEQEIRKIVIQLQQGKRGLQYQIEKFTDKQAFHINIEERDLQEAVSVYFGTDFLQMTAWTKQWEYQGKISKKGTFIPPLVDMGIFTKEGKVVQSKYDKYRQINRFLEMVEDALKELPEGPLNIIDFGCGKSYLTFLLYYYMVEVKKRAVTITGLDLKKTVIEQCRQTAERYHYDNLKFELGDIHGYQTTEPVDMVITLHACDTATDYALFNAIRWNSSVILSVPCCQHEFNRQMDGQQLSILSKYGIIKERTAALMTDAVRGNLLEYSGYKKQLLEFVDMEHSPKNILIRAVKENISEKKKQQALQEVKEIMEAFHFMPTLYRLIFEGEEHE